MTSHKLVRCPTFARLAELAVVMGPVSVKDKLFSALNFIKSKSHDWLQNPHLPNALRLFFAYTFDVQNFPCADALEACKEVAEKFS
ncbi:hypothetical protein FOA52_013766 [Chlamydomonas sp. UWO 241]|nr:hypothetical protein FOA52_013766 [Chlamydomonas sp. UWO 241]